MSKCRIVCKSVNGFVACLVQASTLSFISDVMIQRLSRVLAMRSQVFKLEAKVRTQRVIYSIEFVARLTCLPKSTTTETIHDYPAKTV